jgi:hypothetical protein
MAHFYRCLRKAVLFCGCFSFISCFIFPTPLVAASSGDVPQSEARHAQEAPAAAQSLAIAASNAEPQPLSTYAQVDNLAEAYSVMGPQAPDAPVNTTTTIEWDLPDPTVVG